MIILVQLNMFTCSFTVVMHLTVYRVSGNLALHVKDFVVSFAITACALVKVTFVVSFF